MLKRTMIFAEKVQLEMLITESFIERNRGLLALDALKIQQGLLISPCRSVHTFGMKYALDLVYLNKAFVIVKLVKNVVPNRMSIALFAHSTLELKGGEIERLQLKEGMQGVTK